MIQSCHEKCADIFWQESGLETGDFGLVYVFTKRTQNSLDFIGDHEKKRTQIKPESWRFTPKKADERAKLPHLLPNEPSCVTRINAN